MKRALVLFSAFAALALPALPVLAAGLTTYVNARFSYAVGYPADQIEPVAEAENGDGQAFRPRSGTAEIRVWGGHNPLGRTPWQIADEVEAECMTRPAHYRIARRGLVAVSCITPVGVLYQKTLIQGERMVSLRLVYPASERATWDRVAARMAASLNLH